MRAERRKQFYVRIFTTQGFCSGVSKLKMTWLDFSKMMLQGALKVWVFDVNCLIQMPSNLDWDVTVRDETVY